jgi:hypothetical protein
MIDPQLIELNAGKVNPATFKQRMHQVRTRRWVFHSPRWMDVRFGMASFHAGAPNQKRYCQQSDFLGAAVFQWDDSQSSQFSTAG